MTQECDDNYGNPCNPCNPVTSLYNMITRSSEARLLLDKVYLELKSNKKISDKLMKELDEFYDNYMEYVIQKRKEAGCSTYNDENGVARSIKTREPL